MSAVFHEALKLNHAVYRVNWLRAKARYDRWIEEDCIVNHEMDWTVDWLKTKKTEWEDRMNASSAAHLKAYAARQVKQWDALAHRASRQFEWVKTHKKEQRKRKRPPSV